MTTAFWCVLVAAYLPIFWASIAKLSGSGFSMANNRTPREFVDELQGWRKRAHWAHLNAFEAFPPFAAAVIIGHLLGMPQQQLNTLALAFVALRLLHGVFYLADWGTLRSLVWTGSVGCVVAIFVLSA